MDTEKNVSGSPAFVGPSQFSETTNRLLSLGWEEILRTHGFTNGSHFKWRESECRRRQKNRPGSATLAKHTDYIGITKTCEVAIERFGALEYEYFNLWARNHSLRTEEFTKTLIFVKQQVEREVSNLWIGKDSLHSDWYVRACRPIVKKELSALVEKAESRARGYEIRVLKTRQAAERGRFSQTIFRVAADSSAVVGAGTATPDADERHNSNTGGAAAATSETPKPERGSDVVIASPSESTSDWSRRAAIVDLVKNVHKELRMLKPHMHNESHYESVRKQYPKYEVFEIADQHADVKVWVSNVQERPDCMGLAQEIVARRFNVAATTVKSYWTHRSRQH